MNKILVNFDAISYREKLIDLRELAQQEYENNKDRLIGMAHECVKNTFDLVLNMMEDFAEFSNEINNQKNDIID